MSTPPFKTATRLDSSMIQRLAANLTGRLILPGDPAYESARLIWNRALDRRPGMIVQCAAKDDVVRAVDFARNNDLMVAVRGGGHSFAGHSVCNDGMVIDLSAMDGIQVDLATYRSTPRAESKSANSTASHKRSALLPPWAAVRMWA